MRFWNTFAILMASTGLCTSVASLKAHSAQHPDLSQSVVPDWVFPLNPPPQAGAPAANDNVKPVQVPHSKETFTRAQLGNLFATPDWFPHSHSPMPESVARGRAPDLYACGYCHLPTGQGRPENASLAGLPAPYIVQQLEDFKSGARRSPWHGSYLPTDLMVHVAALATREEVASAAAYFSQQRLNPRVQVLERARVPRSHVVGWVYAANPGAEDEPLGERLLEFAPDPIRHENRDDTMRYVAYVPLGSLDRGKSIATDGGNGLTVACVSCHGPKLQGVGLVPRIAGRSPTYLLRQLLAFQTGARAGSFGQPMSPVMAKLQIGNLIDVAAYAASLPP